MTDSQVKECTAKIKAMADIRKLAVEDIDSIISSFHENLESTDGKPLIDNMTMEEKKLLAKKESEMREEAREVNGDVLR